MKPPLTELMRVRRNSARVALYLAATLTAATGGFALKWLDTELPVDSAAFSWRDRDWAAEPAVKLLQAYVAVDTSLAGGGTTIGAEFLAERLRAAGVEPVIERVGDHEANLWAILEGDDPRAIVLHHHIDVEPVADPAAWRLPPFAGEIEGPWLYGRGTFDMKSVAVAQLEAFTRLAHAAREGRRPARSVIFLATSGEETGSQLGMRWLIAHHPELVARFGVVLTEGGAVEGRTPDDVKYWGTEFAQKRLIQVVVCAGQREPLDALRKELLQAGRGYEHLRAAPEVAAFLRRYAPTRDRDELRTKLAAPEALVRDLPAVFPLPDYLKAMLRDEALPHPVRPAEGGGWELLIYVNLLPGADPAVALAELLPPWRVHGLAVSVYDEGAPAHGSPMEAPVLDAIETAIHAHYPEVPVGPIFLPWTITDARFLRAAGVPAYGFSPFMVLTPEVMKLTQFGKVDERIALPGFVEGVEIYAELLEALAHRH